jgi:hypothetical protein
MGPTQTVPTERVKGFAFSRIGCGLLGFVALAACAAGWVNSDKTPAEVKADKTTCNDEAQEDALMRSGEPRSGYGIPAGPSGGGSAQNPMDMEHREAITNSFDQLYADCMESKGYTRAGGKS